MSIEHVDVDFAFQANNYGIIASYNFIFQHCARRGVPNFSPFFNANFFLYLLAFHP